MVKLVIADMDGTLLNERNEFSENLFEVIEQMKELGVRFAVGSGRQYHNLRKRFETIQEDITFLCENGAMIFDQGRHIYTDEISYEKISEIIQLVRKIPGIYPILCGEKSAYLESDDEIFINNTAQYYERYEVVEDVLKAAQGDKICKLAFFGDGCAESIIYPVLSEYETEFMVAISGENWVDMMNQGVNKGMAVRMIQEKYQIRKEECMAFGDYLNDYEMMQECEYSFAMENAHPLLKGICKYQAASNNEDGVVNALIQFFNLETV